LPEKSESFSPRQVNAPENAHFPPTEVKKTKSERKDQNEGKMSVSRSRPKVLLRKEPELFFKLKNTCALLLLPQRRKTEAAEEESAFVRTNVSPSPQVESQTTKKPPMLLLLLLLLLLECNSRSLAIHHLLMKILNKRRSDEAEITENTHTYTHTAQNNTKNNNPLFF
jgi:hypothetical protein